MANERYLVTALPYSVDPRERFHVSLYIAPRLTKAASDSLLRRFPLFAAWTDALARAELVLTDQTGAPYAVQPASTPTAGLWSEAFPGDTPVRDRSRPPWSGRSWKSFSTRLAEQAGKGVHALSIVGSPLELPAPASSPLTTLIVRLAREHKLWSGREAYDETKATRALDALIEKPGELARLLRAGGVNAVWGLLGELHRARRFYERPESKQPFQARPTPGATRPRLPPPSPDFHERLSLVNDHPELLRALGLVIDLKVEARELPRLRTAQWLAASVNLPAPFDKAALPANRTLCKVAGRALVAVPAGQDLRDGRLRLGDEQRFAVLDLDPDASALKLDRFLWTLPRLALLESKKEPAHAAPPSLRATGLTVVRSQRDEQVKQRVDGAAALDAAVAAGGATLHAEDLLRGYRVEVFDDTAHKWFSLHERKSELHVGSRVVPSAAPGFVRTGTVSETPGVSASPLYVHESVFGWEGYSLSAPYPGRALVHENGKEVFDPPQPAAGPTPISATHHAAPGTLPRLRYGRTYAFRAFTVDLAGNSAPHALNPLTAQPLPGAALESVLRANAASGPSATWLKEARAAVALPLAEPVTVSIGPMEVSEQPREPERKLTGVAALDSLLRERGALRAEALTLRGATSSRREAVARTMARTMDAADALYTETAAWSAERLGRVSAAEQPLVEAGLSAEEVAKLAVDTVSKPRPFLRWDPVAPPTIVARRRYTEGESLCRLVVRSEVNVDENGVLTVVPMSPAAERSERHLAPPKTTQNEVERHGGFDFAIGSPDPATHSRAFRMALRESGTLLDTSVPDLVDASLRHPQAGLSVAGPPGAPPIELSGWPRGEALPQGRYVVHDTDALRVPWLSDPLAKGLTLVFPDANQDRVIRWPLNIESMSTDYAGSYPELVPYRLVLGRGDTASARVEGAAIDIKLPPADTLRLRVSSRLAAGSLDLLGLFRMLPEAVQQAPLLREAAAEGWLWALTPSEEVTLVHAVPRPLKVPRSLLMVPLRQPGSATCALAGALDCHGASSERIDAEAEWQEVADDLNLAGPESRPMSGHAFGFGIAADEDLVALFSADTSLSLPVLGPLQTHQAVHALGDTKHRRITYRFKATTRFREYFPAEVYSDARPPFVTSAPVPISVPSAAVPARPEVASILPLFHWVEGPEPEQPFAWRRTRRVGLRLYLERPWYSSGEGEKLGVLLSPSASGSKSSEPVSEWGADPAWLQRGPAYRAVTMKHEDFVQRGGIDRPSEPAGPSGMPAVVATADGQQVVVLPYEPSYHAERRLWRVDIGIATGAALWPFVRLAVARYQPESLPGCALSKIVHCDFMQLPPERSFTLARPDDRTARVVVSGPIGVNLLGTQRGAFIAAPQQPFERAKLAINAGRRLLARLERREPGSQSDLGWREIKTVTLELEGYDVERGHASFVGSLTLPQPLPVVQPTQNHELGAEWRVTVEEIEILPADPEPGATGLGTEERLVYADTISL